MLKLNEIKMNYVTKLVIFLSALCIFGYLFFTFVLVVVRVPTESMEPTVMAGSSFLGSRISYEVGEPQRFDVAVFYHRESGENYVKRVIGMPGDQVVIKDGAVYVNGEKLYEPYVNGETLVNGSKSEKIYNVPKGHYFMLGDNRSNSSDARYWNNAYISRSDFIAKYFVNLSFRSYTK